MPLILRDTRKLISHACQVNKKYSDLCLLKQLGSSSIFLPLDIAFIIPKMKTILGQVQFFHSLDFQIYNAVHFILGIFSFFHSYIPLFGSALYTFN